FAMAFGLLAIAFGNKGKGKGRPISFTQFKRSLEDGKVILDDTRFKLEVVTTEGAFDAQIVGWHQNNGTYDLGATEAFTIRINLDLDGPKLARLVGSKVEAVGADDPGVEGNITGAQGTYSFADFEEWAAPMSWDASK
ncbi:MAG TPA: hypothetical protein DCQ96_05275, partial [Verrucomicrobiales bacterium]|nr:hypothetical protein [Verrucomicrobiales bacterium]